MNLDGAPQGLWPSFGQADITDFPLLYEFRHRADGFLDWSVWIDPVLIIKIDVIGAQPFQAAFARFAHVVRLAIYAAGHGIVGIADDAKFRRDHQLVTLAANGPAHEFFVLVRAVHIRGVEKINSKFDGAVNNGNRFVVVAGAVELRHSHAAKSEL